MYFCLVLKFIYLAPPTRAGSPQQHMPITVGPFYLTHPVNFPCGWKSEYPGKTHGFRQSVDFYSFHMRHEDWVRVALRKFSLRLEPVALEVKGLSALTTCQWTPKPCGHQSPAGSFQKRSTSPYEGNCCHPKRGGGQME